MFPGIQAQFNGGFNQIINCLVDSVHDKGERKNHSRNIFKRMDIALEKSTDGYNFRAVVFNVLTGFVIVETAIAIITLAATFFAVALVACIFAGAGLFLRELVDQNIKDTATGKLCHLAQGPVLFRKLIM